MTEFTFPDMRSANVARGIEWSNGAKDGTLFYAVELFGEAGELINVVKKLEREKLGMVGSRATEQDLADELADVVICLDLLAIAYDLPALRTATATDDAWDGLSVGVGFGEAVGKVMGKVFEIEHRRSVDGRDGGVACYDDKPQLTALLFAVLNQVTMLAFSYEIDLAEAVLHKFNQTSEKYRLKTRLAAVARIS